MSDYVNKLKSGNELYFISCKQISSPKWIRMPMLTAEEVEENMYLLFDPDIKNFNVHSESSLNELTQVFDDEKKKWVNSWITRRESLFGGRFQDTYEFFCEKSGVNLDLVKEWKSLRTQKEKEINKAQEVA